MGPPTASRGRPRCGAEKAIVHMLAIGRSRVTPATRAETVSRSTLFTLGIEIDGQLMVKIVLWLYRRADLSPEELSSTRRLQILTVSGTMAA